MSLPFGYAHGLDGHTDVGNLQRVTEGPKTGGLWLAKKQLSAILLTAVLPPTLRRPLPLSQPLRVGYLRFDRRVGEVLLQTTIFQAHKAARPQDTLFAITHPGMVRVLDNQPHLDGVIPFAWRGFPFSPSSWRMLSALRALRLDVAVDCSDPSIFSVGHMMATRMTLAPYRVGFARGPHHAHFSASVDVPQPLWEAQARAALLGVFGLQAAPQLHYVPHPKALPASEHGDVLSVLSREPGGHAVLCPGGRLAWRRAQPIHFAAAARTLQSQGRTVWLAPGPGEEELCAQIAQLAPGSRTLPVTDLQQLGALMQSAGMVVCNNSGTMHLSAAVGARTFAFFVKMDPTRWGHHQPIHHMFVLNLEDPHAENQIAQAVAQWAAETAPQKGA